MNVEGTRRDYNLPQATRLIGSGISVLGAINQRKLDGITVNQHMTGSLREVSSRQTEHAFHTVKSLLTPLYN